MESVKLLILLKRIGRGETRYIGFDLHRPVVQTRYASDSPAEFVKAIIGPTRRITDFSRFEGPENLQRASAALA